MLSLSWHSSVRYYVVLPSVWLHPYPRAWNYGPPPPDFTAPMCQAGEPVFVDEAESGRVADRPKFRKMLDEASRPNEPFHEILVW